MESDPINFTPARELARRLATREVSAVEVVRAFIAQVERVNPTVNAIVTFLPEQALQAAKRLDDSPPSRREGRCSSGCPSRTRT
jgi:Asp-tRNAAsn/Glu-tRNAGln amidotransferase A subunit and related amidases